MYKYEKQVTSIIANASAIFECAELMAVSANTTKEITTTGMKAENKKKTSGKKNQKDLEACKREYDASLAAAVRFIAEVATATLDTDNEICGRSRAAKLYQWYKIYNRNNAKGRKMVLHQVMQFAPYLDGNKICERKKLNKDVRNMLGYTGSNCLYVYKIAGWLTALGMAYDNRNNLIRKNIEVITSPNNDNPMTGTIENSKGENITAKEYQEIEKAWIEIKNNKK